MRNPPTPARLLLRRAGAAALALPAALLLAGLPAAAAPTASGAPAAAGTAAVSVDAGTAVATVPSTAIGLNASTYDGKLTDAAVPGLVKGAGVGVMRFPGGTSSDSYDWKTNTDVLSGQRQASDFDQFMTMTSQAGSAPMITVNYGTGDTVGRTRAPQETGAQIAADWVRYANVQHGYQVKYWEIGNEVYGNDTYNAYWEPDEHCGSTFPPAAQPDTCGPAVYARVAAQYIAAMKAVDPTIKVGVVLTAPGSWPDGVTAPGSPQPWNQTVLSTLKGLGAAADFADVHWYPQNPSNVTPPGPTDAGLLADTAQIPGITAALRSQFAQYAGTADLPVMLTETNSVSSNPGKQTVGQVNALYAIQDYAGWIGSGVANVDWWQLHNGIVTSGDNGSDLYGTASYGDYGVLSDASCGTSGGQQVCEPAADTPFPAYYGLKLAGAFLRPGDTVVKAASGEPMVQAYAVKSADGSVKVMLVNDDPATSYTVNLGYTGFTPAAGAPDTSVLEPPGTGISTAARGTATTQTLAPYTAALVTVKPAGTSTATCKVTYAANDWGTGLTATVGLTNTGAAPVTGWTLGFAWSGNQRITNGWNADWSQTGTRVTATNLSWNRVLPPGTTTTIGFNATYTGANPPPTAFTLGGRPCTTG
ncbi:cellulose binding domain-containing protein [Streptomyces sp. NBC_01190]|uniref:cellulose binding domain-containing protein n=1 Tax=Streptomyces sp. NBC_01190 TaxID=2903767 RepID=UPI00386C81F9|nr:cellulose binding domain-containing protein [Streptomyces sp. NBC_01190]